MVNFKALLLDIEGTVTSISFVKEVDGLIAERHGAFPGQTVKMDELFPYAFNNVEHFLKEHFDQENVQQAIHDMTKVSMEEALHDPKVRVIRSEHKEDTIEDTVFDVRYWIENDKKITPMKTLQGLIWEYAYKSGAVKGHVYPDVVPVLKKFHEQGLPIYIYSSGSVYAQKLLFGNSVEGDLTKILSGYFDTNVGLKGDEESYATISHQIGQSPADVLFLTDVEAEARAAHAAGCQTKLLLRPGNAPLSAEARNDFETIDTLEKIL